jgi:hypothetical protein
MDLKVDDEKDGESDAEKIRRALAKKLGEPIHSEYDDWAILDTLENTEHWISSQENTLGYKTRRLLDLEVRFDAASNSWVPCLLLRFEFKDGFVLDVKEYIERNHDKDLEEVFSFGGNEGACLAHKISDKAYRIFFLFTTDLYSEGGAWRQVNANWASEDFRGLYDNEGTHPLDERFLSFLLQTEDKSSWSFNSSIERMFSFDNGFDDGFDDGEFFVKAPDGSIAANILINLAYAKGEKRLDNLLIKDATDKYKMLKEYSERVTKKYEDAISKL